MTKEKITKTFIEFELLNGRKPNSVFELCKKIKCEEIDFYKIFKSLQDIKKEIPFQIFHKTKIRLEADEQYLDYSAREKILALFFTLFEEFLSQRSYFLLNYSKIEKSKENFNDWNLFLNQLDVFTSEILTEGRSNGELVSRSLLDEHSHKGFKLVFTYLFRVWIKDDSEDFTTTDAAIEKSVNLSMDLMQKSSFDTLLDFGKFAFKTKVF